MSEYDVIVVGAGLAGLRAATRLAEAGRDVVVLEAEDAVGGRERTDVVDGFRLDLGFHVLNPAYPAVRRWVDVDALALRRFPVAVSVRLEDRVVRLAHPLRHPSSLPATLASGLVRPTDAVALARWAGPTVLSARAAKTGADRALSEAWDRAGLRGPLREAVLEPFLAGVIADDRQETSDAFVRLLVRSFAFGRPGVPAAGIGALPAQLADTARRAGAGIRLSHRVTGIHPHRRGHRVEIEGADAVHARAVVLSTGLAPGLDVPPSRDRGLQTWWFAADEAPTADGALRVDGRRRGPMVNTAVMTNSAPTYAPRGQHLIQATCVLPSEASETDVRRQLDDVWQTDTRPWRLLRRDDIARALPAQDPPLRLRRRVRLGDGRYVAGDHRDTASIQGALVSGQRAAEAVLADLSR
ncbi:Phytoene dehydrogenase-related protein [Microbacterium sp. ru370.1]|uniref:NAD(P)/FAD-dependent oxidoreductase n=1 Tax=unclassified Microbacterium TaxID=2609290 RepID=UPI0008820C7D|nr:MULTISPECIES: NAD(P)/FAD-dependent oxidoreductase [unclassified Microbacterium]SDO62243.1 Phytoene dehydrogenase-related protein [Microbacterium sp. ru370.1]SIT86569.1 Phytoene dehydrogenase-related protein [Microbacterium sp. RU1D]